MDFVYLFCFILFTSASASHDSTADDYYDFTPEEAIKQTKTPARTNQTPSPLAKYYEVTEKVDDIPNPNPGPILPATNFTLKQPINIAGGNSSRTQAANFPNDYGNPSAPSNLFFQPNLANGNPNFNQDNRKPDSNDELNDGHEFFNDDKPPTGPESDEDDEYSHEDYRHIPNILPFIKRYLSGLEKGIINGLNTIAGKDVFKGSQVNERDQISTPVQILNNYKRRKGHKHEQNSHSNIEYYDFVDAY